MNNLSNKDTKSIISLIAIHVGIAVAVFVLPFLSKILSLVLFFVGLYVIIRTKDKDYQVLSFCAYIVGSEVFFRMTGGNFFNEYSKYTVMIYMFLGIFFNSFSKRALIYIVFILLFIPGIFIGISNLSFEANIRKVIAFNVSGPICLAVSSIYCIKRIVTLEAIKKILIYLSLPIVSIVAYLFLYSPSIKDVVTGTQSNFETSGGFGPNQVSTILGLGMFSFFAILILFTKGQRKLQLIFFVLLMLTSFRAIVTFSRGGVFTALAAIILLLFFIYNLSNNYNKSILKKIAILFVVIGSALWFFTVLRTNGLIVNRYQNKDARGRIKEDKLGGREELTKIELEMFINNPILGVGIGKNKEYREEQTGIVAASHNEISRMLAEQGIFGVICLLLLLITPLFYAIDNRQHIFLFSFYVFWLLTINHAAMRVAAPAFIYALSLLKVTFNEESTVHRESIT